MSEIPPRAKIFPGLFLVLPALLIAVWGVAAGRDLFMGWLRTPLATPGWVAFLIWLLPVMMLWVPGRQDAGGLAAGVACLAAGGLLSAEMLIYLGLAATVAGLLPFSIAKLAWLVAAAGWMPGFAGVAGFGEPGGLIWARVGVVLMGVVVYAWATLLHEMESAVECEYTRAAKSPGW